jgi:hypothetical protein
VVHEVGHFIDMCGLPGIDFASRSLAQSAMDDWRDCVVNSHAMQLLRGLTDPATGADPARVRSLSQLDELWARSDSQFVAIRSQAEVLLRALDRLRERPRTGVYYPVQWEGDDFVAIDRAIELLFRRQGWMTS